MADARLTEVNDFRRSRLAFTKWWFDLIERFLMVGALGVAASLSGSFWLDGLYLVSLVLLAGWTNDTMRLTLDELFRVDRASVRLQNYWQALGAVLRFGGVPIVVVGIAALIYQVTTELVAVTGGPRT